MIFYIIIYNTTIPNNLFPLSSTKQHSRYLRKALFPHHPDLKFAGLLNPLDCPHHMRAHEQYPFREGVILKRPTKKGRGSFADCGIDKVRIELFPYQYKSHYLIIHES